MRRVIERFDGEVPHGPDAHVRLLQAAMRDIEGLRPIILTEATVQALDAHRAFRHFFRHGYGVELEWPRIEPLVRDIGVTHAGFLRDVTAFRAFLDAASRA